MAIVVVSAEGIKKKHVPKKDESQFTSYLGHLANKNDCYSDIDKAILTSPKC